MVHVSSLCRRTFINIFSNAQGKYNFYKVCILSSTVPQTLILEYFDAFGLHVLHGRHFGTTKTF